MVDPEIQGQTLETREDLGTGDAALYAYWEAQEKVAEKEERKWIKRGREIVKRYRDERPESIQNTHRFNILWSNVQTLIPTLYGRAPKPSVERRFKDPDPNGRLAADLMERCLSFSIDNFDIDEVMESVVEDRLLPGRGVARVLYVPHFGDEIKEPDQDGKEDVGEEFEAEDAPASLITNEGDEEDEESEPAREVVYEEAIADYVFWEDYREGPARKWREVGWVRYRSYLTRDELVTRFGKDKGQQVELDYTPKGSPEESVKDEPPADVYKKAIVHEVWDKTKGDVIWYAPGTPDLILDQRPDPLRLPGFFPSPDPLRSTSTNDKRVPVADYIEYQDQARELDSLTARIDRLARALKVSGVYAGEDKQVLQQLVDEGTDNRLIPVGDAFSWADKGGLSKIIEWMPIQQIAETLIQLYNARDRVKATLYEITGIGDIMRGMTEPDETFGAQKLKANFSTRRVSPQQRKVGKFARNLLRLLGGIIAEHFSPKTISMITGFPQLDPVPQVPPQPQPPPPQPMLPPPGMQASPSGNGAGPLQSAPNSAPPGTPMAANSPQPAPPPNPAMQAYQQAMAQWQKAAQAAQQIRQSNQQKQQKFDAAVALIKRDGVHGFRVDIEADSTIAPDEEAEKESRVEFMEKFVPFMEQMVPIAQGNPAMAQLAEELTLFVVRGFKVARPLEETITKAFQTLAQMPPPPPKGGKADGPDSPADLAVRTKQIQADQQADQTKLQIAREKNAVDMAKLGAETHIQTAELAAKETEARTRAAMDAQHNQGEERLRAARIDSLATREAGRLT